MIIIIELIKKINIYNLIQIKYFYINKLNLKIFNYGRMWM